MARPATAHQTPPPATEQRPSLIVRIAQRYSVDPDKLSQTLKATVFKSQPRKDGTIREATNEELMMLLVIADQYNLNPFTREIYAFFDEKRGGIVPIVSIDGWIRIINERPELDAIEFDYGGGDEGDEDGPWIGCTIHRKDRTRPVQVREYLTECRRDTGPWDTHPRRMLRHKALIQAARLAFGFAGIYDPDEGERIAMAIDVTPRGKPATVAPKALEQKPASEMPWQEAPAAAAEKAPAGAVLDEAKSRALDAQLAAEESSGE